MHVILVTNDDGGSSQGICVLSKALQPAGEVYVVAPEREQSAVGHALTLHRPLKFEKLKNKNYSINGTPTDCVILGVKKLLPEKPDIIVAGINHGGNMGDDVTYSGTVAAAIEGTLLGIPSIAVSFVGDIHNNRRSLKLKAAALFTRKLVLHVLKNGLPSDTFLNVNVPDTAKIKGIKLTRQGKRIYDNAIQEMLDPKGRKHYWIGGGIPMWEQGSDTDFQAVQKSFISITPVHLDLTNHNALKHMKKNWKLWERL